MKKKPTLIRRSVPADDQETQSIGQFVARLGELKWKPQGPRKDYGEDYLVQIWDDGVPSGLSFYVQIKSITNAEKRKGKRDSQTLRYKLEVKDIDHWAAHAVPVVLVIWDIQEHVGYWQTIRRIVEGLEKEKPQWRENVYVTVGVPVANTTSDEGMGRLRREIALQCIPIFMGREPFKVEIQFPGTDEGTALLSKFKVGLDHGREVVFENGPMSKLVFPSWHQRIFGEGEVKQVVISPLPWENNAPPVSIEVASILGERAVIPFVELRVRGIGGRMERVSNEHQGIPWEFTIVSTNEGMRIRCAKKRLGRSVNEAIESTRFLKILSMWGSRLIIRDINTQKVIIAREAPIINADAATTKRTLELLEKLAVLEPLIERFGKIDLSHGISDHDAKVIENLFEMSSGHRTRSCNTIEGVARPGDELLPAGNTVVFEFNRTEFRLLGVNGDLGRAKHYIENAAVFIDNYNAAILEARKTQQPAKFQVVNAWISVELVDWPPSRNRLQDLAATQSGYFTLRQALEVGFASAEQLEIHERIKCCGKGVYRFVLHPASEHEDLIIAWLQTEKQGVFSHDTALALHQLSDILPARIHITVPPEWKPVEGMELAPNVVVHHGSVAATEMHWMGPVPFTKLLRTIEDCIRDHLSPDLLEQAIANGYQRGILTPENRLALQTQIRASV